MIATLLFVVLEQAADPGPWKALPAEKGGSTAYRVIDPDTDSDPRRLIVRVTPPQPLEWASGELAYDLSCRARTLTIVSVRSMDADGVELRFVPVPEDRRRTEPIYDEEGIGAPLYADLCPGGVPLDPPPPPPQIVAVPRR